MQGTRGGCALGILRGRAERARPRHPALGGRALGGASGASEAGLGATKEVLGFIIDLLLSKISYDLPMEF